MWSSCLRSRKEEERVHEEDKQTKSNRSSQTRRYWNQPEEATPERSKQHGKQPSHKHDDAQPSMMHVRFNEAWHGKMHKQSCKLSGAQHATELHFEENTT